MNNPYCSPSTSRAIKKWGVRYFPPGLVKRAFFTGILLRTEFLSRYLFHPEAGVNDDGSVSLVEGHDGIEIGLRDLGTFEGQPRKPE